MCALGGYWREWTLRTFITSTYCIWTVLSFTYISTLRKLTVLKCPRAFNRVGNVVFPIFLLLLKFSSSVDVISSIFVRLRTAQRWHVLALCSPRLLEFRLHLFSPFIGFHRASWTFLYVFKPCLQSLFMSLTRNTYMSLTEFKVMLFGGYNCHSSLENHTRFSEPKRPKNYALWIGT